MRKMLRFPVRVSIWMFVASVTLSLPAFGAEGVNLAWNHCFGEGTGVQNLTFACDTNVGSRVMTGSFVPGRDLTDIIGLEIVVDLASASVTLPPWWQFRNPGSCRLFSLKTNPAPDPSDVVCVDWSAGQAQAGLAVYCVSGALCQNPAANAARMLVTSVVTAGLDLTAFTEYFAFRFGIDNANTVGTGSCAGCEVPVCIVLNSIDIVSRDNLGSRKLTTASQPGSNFIAWQGGAVGGPGCPAATATHHSAWGEVKSLYR